MKVIPLQSGSGGNCIYLESGGTQLLFDAGISGIQAQNRLLEYGVDIRTVNALFITHDHRDHTQNINAFHRKYRIPLWMTMRTHETIKWKGIRVPENVNYFTSNSKFRFENLAIEAIATTHDAADGVCFVVDDGRCRFGICTDLGCVFPGLPTILETLDGVLIESNYDPEMLENGFYPEALKERIRSSAGHISNYECATLIAEHGKRLKKIILGHISQENNTEKRVLATHRKILGRDFDCTLAHYYTSTDPIEI